MRINDVAYKIHKTAVRKGWWEDIHLPLNPCLTKHAVNIASKLALIHSEVSEALEELRAGDGLSDFYYDKNGKPYGFAVELADAVIRILDLAEAMGIDMEEMIKIKMAYNEKRAYKHGGKKL